MYVRPPKEINNWYGYRTPLSTKNQDNWEFAQNHSRKMFLNCGVLMILLGAVSGYFLFEGNTEVIFIVETFVVLPIFCAVLLFSTHIRLKKFDRLSHKNKRF